MTFLTILAVLLGIVVFIVVFVLTVVVIALLLPYRFELIGVRDANETTTADAKILLGGVRLHTFRIAPREKKEEKPKKEKEKKEKKRSERLKTAGMNMAKRISPDAVRETWMLLVALWRSLQLKARVTGVYGFDDPSTTGLVYGAYQAVARPLGIADTVYPVFTEKRLQGEAFLSARIWPADILIDALTYIFSRPVRRIWFPEIRTMLRRR